MKMMSHKIPVHAVSLLVICVYAFLGIAGPNHMARPFGCKRSVTIEQNKISHGFGEPMPWKIRRHNLPEDRFRVFPIVTVLLQPIPSSEHFKGNFFPDKNFLPTASRYYIPPSRDLPALSTRS